MPTKTCTTCHETKNTTEFSTNKTACRPCVRIYDQNRGRSLEGMIKRIYQNQRKTAKTRGRVEVSYSLDELREWLLANNFETLWKAWAAAGYNRMLAPSVDRKDNMKGYDLSNIQLVTWRKNLDSQKAMNISGEYLHSDSKAVKQFSLDGLFIAEFPSIAIAVRTVLGRRTGVSNVSSVCNGVNKTAYGYLWEWATPLS